jgi:DNA-binding CsgD family transcriptional regulator
VRRAALVGRTVELSDLERALDDALRGSPHVVLCEGEPGIGKTRLAQEIAARAVTRGVVVAWGNSSESDGAPPFWPWWQLLRTLAERTDLVTAAKASGVAGDLAGVAPDVFAGPTSAGSGPAERFRQFDAVSVALREVCRQTPLLLVLDDTHWADRPTLLLLRHVARTLTDERLLVLANARSDQCHGDLVAAIAREPVTVPMRLTGLDGDAVAANLRDLIGGEVDPEAAARVAAATGGNPFFVGEIGRAWGTGADRTVLVTPTLRHTIDERLAGLSPGASALVRAAAVVGQSFSIRVVVTTAALDVHDAPQLVDEAARATLIERVAAPDEHRFVHALVRDAVEASMTTADRVDLHRRAARSLEHHHAPQLGPHLFEIARHWEEAGTYGDADVAYSWVRRAADEAMRQLAYEDAVRLYERAVSLAASLDDRERVQLLVALSRARISAGQVSGHMATCLDAAELAQRIEAADLLAEVALAMDATAGQGFDIATRRVCESALDRLPEDARRLRARVLAHYIETFTFRAELADLGATSDTAMEQARASGDSLALADTLGAARVVQAGPDGLARRSALAEEMLALGRRERDAAMELSGQLWAIDVAFERGDFAAVGRAIEALALAAREVRGPLAHFEVLRAKAVLAQAQGRFPDARRLEDEAFRIAAPTGHVFGYVLRSGLLAAIGHHTGQDETTIGANRMHMAPQGLLESIGLIAQVAVAHAAVDAGDLETARTVFQALAPVAQWQPPPHVRLICHAYAVAVATALGRLDDVASARQALEPHRGHHVVSGTTQVAYSGPVELWLGIASRHLGRLPDAVADLEQAMAACRRSGAAAFEVECMVELAETLATRGSAADQQRARSLLGDAARAAGVLGMERFLARIRQLQERVNGDRRRLLTPREREVALLVAQGLTNREIASTLVLSERTADNHVQHILGKLGLANRSQIAVWVTKDEHPI